MKNIVILFLFNFLFNYSPSFAQQEELEKNRDKLVFLDNNFDENKSFNCVLDEFLNRPDAEITLIAGFIREYYIQMEKINCKKNKLEDCHNKIEKTKIKLLNHDWLKTLFLVMNFKRINNPSGSSDDLISRLRNGNDYEEKSLLYGLKDFSITHYNMTSNSYRRGELLHFVGEHKILKIAVGEEFLKSLEVKYLASNEDFEQEVLTKTAEKTFLELLDLDTKKYVWNADIIKSINRFMTSDFHGMCNFDKFKNYQDDVRRSCHYHKDVGINYVNPFGNYLNLSSWYTCLSGEQILEEIQKHVVQSFEKSQTNQGPQKNN